MPRWFGLTLLFAVAIGAPIYSGPAPAKADVPYLVHAGKLVETESTEAKEQQTKDGVTYVIAGASSPVKTPLASPIFVMKPAKLAVEKLQLFQLQTAGGHREITFSKKKNPEPFTFTVKPLGNGMYQMEVNDSLPNGEYSVTPSGSNQAFCFAVY